MKLFLVGLLAGFVILPIAGLLYLRFGYVPVAVDGPVIPFEELLAGTAIQAKIAREAPAKAAIPASEENILAGAKLYRGQCVECHGLPASSTASPGGPGSPNASVAYAPATPQTPAAKGMYPPPPQFFERQTVGNDPVGQDYWIIANGIRLTGMPGYKPSLSEQQLWQLAQFISNRGNLPDSAAVVLRSK